MLINILISCRLSRTEEISRKLRRLCWSPPSVLKSRQLFVSVHPWQSGLSPIWGLVMLTFHWWPKCATWIISSPTTWRIRRILTISCMPFMGRLMALLLAPFLDSVLTRLRSCSACTPHHTTAVNCGRMPMHLTSWLLPGRRWFEDYMAASIFHSLQCFAVSHGRIVCCWHYVYEDC